MKKVVMLNSMSFLPYQGRYLRIYNEAKTLVDAGYDVTLIAWDRDCNCPPQEIIDGIKVERIALRSEMAKGPRNLFKVVFFNMKLLARLWRRSVDVVHCFNLDTIPSGMIVAKLRRKRLTLDLCEPNYYMYWSKKHLRIADLIGTLERLASPLFDAIFVHNLYQMKKFRSFGARRLVQISSVPGGEMIRQEEGKRERGAGDEIVLGRIGTVYPESGFEEIVAAFKRLIERKNPARLLIAGKVLEVYEPMFQALIEPIRDHVDLIGAFDISEMPNLYRRIDLSVQIHKITPWFKNITPTKFFESLANGVPVVASDIGDYRELMNAHRCGIVVDETKPEEVCEAIEGLIRAPETLEEMSASGLELIREEYSWPIMAARLREAYGKL